MVWLAEAVAIDLLAAASLETEGAEATIGFIACLTDRRATEARNILDTLASRDDMGLEVDIVVIKKEEESEKVKPKTKKKKGQL